MRIIFLITLVLFVALQTKVSMSNSNQICFASRPGDSAYFGSSVVINDKYMAVGDPGANRVVIFRKIWKNKWLRWRAIFPPKDSIPFKAGNGFGKELELDKNILVIGAETARYLENFQDTNNLTSTFLGRYLTRIDRKEKVHRIGLKSNKKFEFVEFNLLSEDKIKSFTLPNRGELGFGFAVESYNNLALIGSPSHSKCGKAWLFNLEKIEDAPESIGDSSLSVGETVAISENFLAVGNFGELGISHYWGYVEQTQLFPLQPHKTLIKSLNNGSVRIIDTTGSLSLSNNILAIKSPEHDKSDLTVLLQVLRLNDNAAPCLILQREDLENAWVQNNYLITVKRRDDRTVPDVCIETIS